jgi:uncharacterized membrane protein YjgN (DUF898 family)
MEPMQPEAEITTAGAAPRETVRFAFNGRAGEYFRIWIVNVFLSIITVGIYSAWAKVRIRRYVYGHTLLGDLPFAYDANPWAILRGRLIAVALVGLWTGLGYVSPLAQLALLVPLAFVVPALIVASLRFNARASSYRNVGFSFDGDYGGALGVYVGNMILAGLTMYGMLPWAVRRQKQWFLEHLSWGDKRLRLDSSVGSFYLAHLPIFVGMVVFFIVLMVAMISWIASLRVLDQPPPTEPEMPAWLWAVLGACYVALFATAYWTRAAVLRLVLNGLRAGDGASVACTMRPLAYTWIVASNWLLALVTLGMLFPWGEVRRQRYLTSHLTVAGFESLEDAKGARLAAGSAAGEEIANAFDIDAGF